MSAWSDDSSEKAAKQFGKMKKQLDEEILMRTAAESMVTQLQTTLSEKDQLIADLKAQLKKAKAINLIEAEAALRRRELIKVLRQKY